MSFLKDDLTGGHYLTFIIIEKKGKSGPPGNDSGARVSEWRDQGGVRVQPKNDTARGSKPTITRSKLNVFHIFVYSIY